MNRPDGIDGARRKARLRALLTPAGWLCACVLLLPLRLSASSPDTVRRTITILFTHDLHSQILPHPSVVDDGPPRETGGFARLSSAITRERSRHPSATIAVDAGDYSMGTLFHTLVMDRAVELRMLGLMGYDAGTLGNHDLDFRWDGLERSLRAARSSGDRVLPLLSSNLIIPEGVPSLDSLRDAFQSYGIRDHMVLTRNGVRIGIFALMGEDAGKDCPSLDGVIVGDAAEAAERMVTLLRTQEHVDLVVCLSHSGTSSDHAHSEDEQLAERVPGIDVIVSGHTHRILTRPLRIGTTLIVSAGANCAGLGALDLDVGNGTVTMSDYRLIPLDASIPDDPVIAKRAAGFVEEIDSVYLRPFGFTFHQELARTSFAFETVEYGYVHKGELRLGDLITDAFAYAVRKAEGPSAHPIDVVIQPLGMIRHTFGTGPITVDDVFRALSLGRGPDGQPGYPLVATYVTGEDLRTILEVGPTLASIKGDVHLQFKGVRFTFNPHRLPLNRVTHAELVDDAGMVRPIHPDSLYRVCVDYYTAIMIGSLTDLSYGIIRVQPRDVSGNPVAAMQRVIIDADTLTPGVQELKEWLALASYLQSFPVDGAHGVPAMPLRYSALRGWSTEEYSWHPVEILRGPNQFALRGAGGVIAIIGIVLLMVFIVRQRAGRTRTHADQGRVQ